MLKCVHRAGLEPAGIVFEPLASSHATLLAEEKHVGCILLDIGGGTTDIAVFAEGGVIHSATIPVGGNILTNDIALGLKTTFGGKRENIKRTYGSGLMRPDEAEQAFHVKTLDGRSTREVTSAQLRSIVLPRVLENVPARGRRTSSNISRAIKVSERSRDHRRRCASARHRDDGCGNLRVCRCASACRQRSPGLRIP